MPVIDADNILISLDRGLTEGKVIRNCAILCRGGKIYAIGGASAFDQAHRHWHLDLPDCYAMPGFIDCHSNGLGPYSLLGDEDPGAALKGMATEFARHGITSFLPTVTASSRSQLPQRLARLAAALGELKEGANALGIHLVGPFINPVKRGAVPVEGVRPYNRSELEEIITACAGRLKLMTLAPETPGAEELIRLLISHGITPSLGHSTAEAREVLRSIDAGARRCTHLFNCMTPLHQRQIGLASTALVDERVVCELIFDGSHIHPQMLDLACRSKSHKAIIAIGAGTRGTDLPPGTHRFLDGAVIVDGQHVRLEDGTIAGSVTTLERHWPNMLLHTHLPEIHAVACFTSTPARSLGLRDRGTLYPGMRGDIVIMNAQHEVEVTLVGGRITYIKNPEKLKKP